MNHPENHAAIISRAQLGCTTADSVGLEDPPPPPGLDITGDGVIDDDDVQAVKDNYGDCPV
ncbi:MAG: hypothetical protein ACPGU1_23150 [Myxococcota bacterium]